MRVVPDQVHLHRQIKQCSIVYRQLCLIWTDVDPAYLSGLGKIQIMHLGIICIGRDLDLQICPV